MTPPPPDWNGLVRFAERRNLVSARVPSHFERSLCMHQLITQVLHFTTEIATAICPSVLHELPNFIPAARRHYGFHELRDGASPEKQRGTRAMFTLTCNPALSVVQWKSYWWKPQLDLQFVQLIHEVSMRFILAQNNTRKQKTVH